jgi:tetratricopeptide (TPR) repeat protein
MSAPWRRSPPTAPSSDNGVSQVSEAPLSRSGLPIARKPARPLLSGALIVKNEERFLDDCLSSIRPIVDEIVVVDTGSTDRSREIARSHGARLIDFPWAGDFAAARNAGLAAAHGRWILYIDADERLAPVDRATVEGLLAAPDLVSARLWLRPRSGFTRYREYRLFLNDPRIRFQGIVHEKVTPDIDRAVEERGLRVVNVDLRLEHVGYDGPQDHKHLRNLPLLQAELALRPQNAYNWHHLGRVFDGLGDRAAALDSWRRSLAVARSHNKRSWDWVIYVELIQAEETDPAEARRLHAEASALFPGNPLLRFWGAKLDSQAGDQDSAIATFQALAAIDAETFFDPLTAFDQRLFGEFSYAALGACYFKLGRYVESAAWYAKAAAVAPDSPEYRIKQQLAAAKAGSV